MKKFFRKLIALFLASALMLALSACFACADPPPPIEPPPGSEEEPEPPAPTEAEIKAGLLAKLADAFCGDFSGCGITLSLDIVAGGRSLTVKDLAGRLSLSDGELLFEGNLGLKAVSGENEFAHDGDAIFKLSESGAEALFRNENTGLMEHDEDLDFYLFDAYKTEISEAAGRITRFLSGDVLAAFELILGREIGSARIGGSGLIDAVSFILDYAGSDADISGGATLDRTDDGYALGIFDGDYADKFDEFKAYIAEASGKTLGALAAEAGVDFTGLLDRATKTFSGKMTVSDALGIIDGRFSDLGLGSDVLVPIIEKITGTEGVINEYRGRTLNEYVERVTRMKHDYDSLVIELKEKLNAKLAETPSQATEGEWDGFASAVAAIVCDRAAIKLNAGFDGTALSEVYFSCDVKASDTDVNFAVKADVALVL